MHTLASLPHTVCAVEPREFPHEQAKPASPEYPYPYMPEFALAVRDMIEETICARGLRTSGDQVLRRTRMYLDTDPVIACSRITEPEAMAAFIEAIGLRAKNATRERIARLIEQDRMATTVDDALSQTDMYMRKDPITFCENLTSDTDLAAHIAHMAKYDRIYYTCDEDD
jgi:hypothetical protein